MNFKKTTIFISFNILIIYLILIISLFYFFNSSKFFEILTSKRTIFSIQISIKAAFFSTFLSTLFALPAAYALSRYNFKGKFLVDTILELPMIVSPAALGAMVLIFFNNSLGIWIRNNVVDIIFSFYGIIVAQFLTILGISTRLIKSVFDEIPTKYEIISMTLGVSHFKSFLKVTLPLAKSGIFYSIILTFAKALGEFGATMMIAGTMPLKTETLTIAVYNRLSSAEIEFTVVNILLLIFIGFSLLILIKFFSKNGFKNV